MKDRKKRLRRVRFRDDERGQGMTEYVILSAVTIAAAAYLYHPDNMIFQGIRTTFDKTMIVVPSAGP